VHHKHIPMEASMGPRSEDRGNLMPFPTCAALLATLQWGRDLKIAEIRNYSSATTFRRRLQWGRDLKIAEIEPVIATSAREARLQWGRDLKIAEIG